MFKVEIRRRAGFRVTIVGNVIAVLCSTVRAQTLKPNNSNDGLQVFNITSTSGSKPDFEKLREVLTAQTNVPVKLPAFLPYIDAKHPVAASLVLTASSSYEIALGWGEDCFSPDLLGGAGACHYGTIRGSAERLIENEGRRVPLNLAGGVHGYFVPFTCGAHCDDSAIGWDENGYHYSIGLKAGSEKVLTRVANSAISQQHEKVLARK
jgi:hypothetical protein